MAELDVNKLKKVPHSDLMRILDRLRTRLKDNKTVQDMFNEYEVNLDEIDLIPMAFTDLPVSARTEHGIIYLNTALLKDGNIDLEDHYLVHEMTHYLQQTTGDKPTKGSNDDNYLDNEYEQEGFQNQTKYLAETRGNEAAEEYIDKVLDHHDIPENEKETRKEKLLNIATRNPEQLGLNFLKKKTKSKMPQGKAEMDKEYDEAITRGPQESHARPTIKRLHPLDQKERIRKLKELLDKLNVNKEK